MLRGDSTTTRSSCTTRGVAAGGDSDKAARFSPNSAAAATAIRAVNKVRKASWDFMMTGLSVLPAFSGSEHSVGKGGTPRQRRETKAQKRCANGVERR